MVKIVEYKLDFVNHQTINLPFNSNILYVKNNNDYDTILYVTIDNEQSSMESHEIYMFENNQNIDDKLYHYLYSLGVTENYNGIIRHVFAQHR